MVTFMIKKNIPVPYLAPFSPKN